MKELLLEIGTEELPYHFIAPALAALASSAERALKEHRLMFRAVRTVGTPRRLVLVVEELAAKQAPAVAEVMGPSKAVAFDASGQPTKAAKGFAASHQIPVGDLEVRATPKGEYVFAVKRDAGRPTAAVLADLLPALLGGLSFPKAMRWNPTGTRFARPVRWLVALYGGRVIPCVFGGVRAGNRTQGHRVLGRKSQALTVKDFKTLTAVLSKHGVEVDPDRRRAAIAKQVAEQAKAGGGLLHQDDDLLEQAVFTTESPRALLGRFDPAYLAVPKPVLMTAMKEHQGFFSVVGRDGQLRPAFVSVANLPAGDLKLIREGNERVLAARLSDARFFFDEDRKLKLENRVAKLDQVVFHQRLGTLRQKAERLRGLAREIAELTGHSAAAAACERAAFLCKADLLTGMVGEFPTLQGVMGGEYARHDGESPEVAQAIREHYLPPSAEGELPQSGPGRLLSLTDRLDTISAFFSVGLIPSGSEDPYALRRHATAIVRIVVESPIRLDLGRAVDAALTRVAQDGFRVQGANARRQILEFLFERLRHLGRTTLAIRNDVMDAVLRPVGDGPCDLVDLVERMKALQAITGRPEFDPLMVGFKRAHRIVEKEKWSSEVVDAARFEHPSESALQSATGRARTVVPEAIGRQDYARALDALVQLKPAIDDFFNNVMVNAENADIRANRLSVLCSVDRLFMIFGDFSQIAVQGG